MIFIETERSITVFFANGPKSIDCEHPNFSQVSDLLHDGDDDLVETLMEPVRAVQQAFANTNGVSVINGAVYYNNEIVHNSVTTKILAIVAEGKDPARMIKYLERLMQNPSRASVQELYGFQEANNLPITEDGCFIAYKRIRDNWTDCHSGKVDNSIGATPRMRRNQVDDNRNNTCSYGYHVCGYHYLQHFLGSRLVAVKVDPADVVSVPTDYNNSKMRVCGYEVLRELPMPTEWTVQNDYLAESNVWNDVKPFYYTVVEGNDGDRSLAEHHQDAYDPHHVGVWFENEDGRRYLLDYDGDQWVHPEEAEEDPRLYSNPFQYSFVDNDNAKYFVGVDGYRVYPT